MKQLPKVLFVFSGAGKSYVKAHENELGIHVVDNDVMYLDRHAPGFAERYFKTIADAYVRSDIDYVLCNPNLETMKLVKKAGIPFGIVTPVWNDTDIDKYDNLLTDDMEVVKAIIFGRLVLRRKQTGQNIGWLEERKQSFESRTALSNFLEFLNSEDVMLIPLTVKNNSLKSFIA